MLDKVLNQIALRLGAVLLAIAFGLDIAVLGGFLAPDLTGMVYIVMYNILVGIEYVLVCYLIHLDRVYAEDEM